MFKKQSARQHGDVSGREVEQSSLGRGTTAFKIIALIGILVTLAALYWPQETMMVKKTVTIGQGDTLWNVAEQAVAEGDVRDPREIIWRIRKDNAIDAYIRPGDKITVWLEVLKEVDNK